MNRFVPLIVLVGLAVPASAASSDTIYKCVRSDGEVVVSFNRRLPDMRCTVYQSLNAEPEKPKGAKCRVQRFRDTLFYKCEKDGVWYIFNRRVDAVETGPSEQPSGTRTSDRAAGTSGRRVSSEEVTLSALPGVAGRVPDLKSIVAAAASEYAIPEPLLMAVIEVESGFNPDVVSPVGAQGLMQLMPVTADYLNVEDPFDPTQNVRAGARLLRILSDKFDVDLDLVFAAYYAGAGAV